MAEHLLGAPSLRVLLLQIRIEARIFDGVGRLGGEQPDHLDAIGGEGRAGEVVFEIDHAGEAALVDDGRGERGARRTAGEAGIAPERPVDREVVEQDGLARPRHVRDDAGRRGPCDPRGRRAEHVDRPHRRCGARPRRRAVPHAGAGRTPPRAGVLDQDAHERVEQAVEDDLARDGLGGLEHRAEVERGAGGRGRLLRARRAAEDLAGDEVGVRALEAPHRIRARPIGRRPCAPR